MCMDPKPMYILCSQRPKAKNSTKGMIGFGRNRPERVFGLYRLPIPCHARVANLSTDNHVRWMKDDAWSRCYANSGARGGINITRASRWHTRKPPVFRFDLVGERQHACLLGRSDRVWCLAPFITTHDWCGGEECNAHHMAVHFGFAESFLLYLALSVYYFQKLLSNNPWSSLYRSNYLSKWALVFSTHFSHCSMLPSFILHFCIFQTFKKSICLRERRFIYNSVRLCLDLHNSVRYV